MTDVVITGASGFIGHALHRRLLSDGLAVHAHQRADGDVALQATWDAMPPAKIVVHLAGRSYVPDSWNDGPGFLRSNVIGTEQAMDYCRKHGARMVFISAYVYGIPESLPIAESHAVHPNNPYALTKHLAEQVCQFYGDVHRIPVTILRLFNVFGPGQRDSFLIPSILAQIRSGKEIRVLDLKPRRDYIYIADVLEAICQAMRLQSGMLVLNIGSGRSLAVREVIEQIQRVAGKDLPVISSGQERPQEIPDVRADISLARRTLGWEPRWSFRQGIAELLSKEAKID